MVCTSGCSAVMRLLTWRPCFLGSLCLGHEVLESKITGSGGLLIMLDRDGEEDPKGRPALTKASMPVQTNKTVNK